MRLSIDTAIFMDPRGMWIHQALAEALSAARRASGREVEIETWLLDLPNGRLIIHMRG